MMTTLNILTNARKRLRAYKPAFKGVCRVCRAKQEFDSVDEAVFTAAYDLNEVQSGAYLLAAEYTHLARAMINPEIGYPASEYDDRGINRYYAYWGYQPREAHIEAVELAIVMSRLELLG